jgi:hypothetical protein
VLDNGKLEEPFKYQPNLRAGGNRYNFAYPFFQQGEAKMVAANFL